MDAISINVGDVYTIAIISPDGLLGTIPAPLPPVTLQSSTSTQATFSINASPLPMSQTPGMAICPVGGSNFNLLVLANPATVALALGIVESGLRIDQSSMPIGVYCDNAVPLNPKIYVGTGGGYAISFSLPSGVERFESIDFPTVKLPYLISGDGLTAWIFNNHTTPHADIQSVEFTFYISSGSTAATNFVNLRRTFDPTIINNPINQGGGEIPKIVPGQPEPRPEPVAALAA